MKEWVFALLLVEVALVAITGISASSGAQVLGPTAVHTRDGVVYLAIDHQVLVTDEQGELRSRLLASDGAPWAFGAVFSIASDISGRVFVADGERGQVVRFESDGSRGRVVTLSRAPATNFEVQPLPGEMLAVAATIQHGLWIIGPRGALIAEQAISYPNGLALSADGERLFVVETGARRVHAFDLKLRRVEAAALEQVRQVVAREREADSKVELLGGLFDHSGEYRLLACLNTDADCRLVGASGPIVDLTLIHELDDAADPNIPLWGSAAYLGDGSLIVASPRLSRVFLFRAVDGILAPGFFGPAVDASAVDLGSSGTRIGLFGGPELRERYAGDRALRRSWSRAEQGARYTAFALLMVLLVGLFMRSLGAAASGVSWAAVWRRVVRPDSANLCRTGALIVAGVLLGAGAGLLSGFTSIAATSAVFGGAVLSAFAAPGLIRRRSDDVARGAFELFTAPVFGREDSEPVRAVTCERAPRGRLLDLLDSVMPRLTVAVRTQTRLIRHQAGLLGEPTGPVECWRVEGEGAETARPARRADEVWCHRCWASALCRHTRSTIAWPVALSVLLPGAGHLVQGRLVRGRTLAVLAMLLALDALRSGLPQWAGTLPSDPSRWELQALAFAALAFVAVIDVSFEAVRRQGWSDE